MAASAWSLQPGGGHHLTENDLDRYYLRMVTDDAELAALEEHLLGCAACIARAVAGDDYVDAFRVAATLFND